MQFLLSRTSQSVGESTAVIVCCCWKVIAETRDSSGTSATGNLDHKTDEDLEGWEDLSVFSS